MFPLSCENAQYHQTIWAVKSHSQALATFLNIVKTLKQTEPIGLYVYLVRRVFS